MKTVKTVWSNLIESYKMFNHPLALPNYVTLNDKYGIPSINNDITKVTLGYYTLGIRKDGVTADTTHDSADREVFVPLPFLIVPTSTGLTSSQKDMFKIRVVKTINNVEYIMCYVKKVTAIDVDMSAYNVEYNQTSKTFTPSLLVPSQAYTNAQSKSGCGGDKITNFHATSTKVTVSLSIDEIASAKAAANIMYGIPNPTFNEVGLYTGIPDANGELSNTTAYIFRSIDPDNYNADGSMSVVINIGGMTAV